MSDETKKVIMETTDKIFIAGHKGMVGSALVRLFQSSGYNNLILKDQKELDLLNHTKVKTFFEKEKPDIVILAAARVGGINANMKHQAEFLYENLEIQNNVIYQAFLNKVKKFCFLGSSCIYPKDSPQPIKEEYLLTGPLEPTNEGYAIAKIAGYKLCYYLNKQHKFNCISVMPCNLYGTNDHYDLENSHVLSALIRRYCDALDNDAKHVTLWGTGISRREFLHVDDLASATLFLLNNHNNSEIINVGSGEDISIRDLASLIKKHTGFEGETNWDSSMPDGMPRKFMDSSKMKDLGWKPTISLEEGIKKTIKEYRESKNTGKIN